MSALTDLVFELAGEFLALPAVGLVITASLLLLTALWVASAWWAYRDARHRVTDPVTPFLVATGVLVLTPLFFPMAIVVWRVLRPASTIRDRYAADLQRELLVAGAERVTCQSCARPVEDGWVRCPSCKVALATSCTACDRPVGLDWSICAWCATDLVTDESAPEPAPEPELAPVPVGAPVSPKLAPAKPGPAKAAAASLRRSAAVLGASGTSR